MATLPIPQPSTPTYPATALNLFATILRGPGDPPYDPTRRPKYWKDPAQANASDPSAFVQYLVIHRAGTSWVVTNVYMPASEAASTNFPDPSPPNIAPPPMPPAWETPIRPLLPGEELYPTPFGLLIRRTDLPNEPAIYTTDDKAAIHAIAAKILGS